MPYIPPLSKKHPDPTRAVGDLNYGITMLIEAYRLARGDRYQTFNDIVGALDNAKDEFRRRVVHPYEDRMCAENGDVYAPLRGDS